MHRVQPEDSGTSIGRFWAPYFLSCVLVSLGLILATALTRLGIASGPAEAGLRMLTLAVENNAGAWWSGMLLLALALHCYDGSARYRGEAPPLARAYAIIAAILLFLSLDEIGSVHERLGGLGLAIGLGEWGLVLPLGAVLGVFFLRALVLIWSMGPEHRRLVHVLFIGFGMLGSVAVQEFLEHRLVWSSPAIDAVRVAVEEGTELAGMLLLLWVAMDNTAPFGRRVTPRPRPTFAALDDLWRPMLLAALIAVPVATIATGIVAEDNRGRPADWIAAAGFALAALCALRPWLAGAATLGRMRLAFVGLCFVASVLVLRWPASGMQTLLGAEISTRMIVLAPIFFLIGAVGIMRSARQSFVATVFYALLAAVAAIMPLLGASGWEIHLFCQMIAAGTLAIGIHAHERAPAPEAVLVPHARVAA